jgi:hypothetical protein
VQLTELPVDSSRRSGESRVEQHQHQQQLTELAAPIAVVPLDSSVYGNDQTANTRNQDIQEVRNANSENANFTRTRSNALAEELNEVRSTSHLRRTIIEDYSKMIEWHAVCNIEKGS